MDTATNFSFNSDAHLTSNSPFHFNNINLDGNSNLKSKMNNNVSNFSFALNSNLSKENSISNSNDISSMYGNFNNMKGNIKPSPFSQWRNKQKQKRPRYFRNDINIESDEEEEEEEDDDEEETSSIPEIFKFEDSASFGKQNSSSSRVMNNSSKLNQGFNKNSYLFNSLEGKNKDIRSSSTPNINAFFNKNINRDNRQMSENIEIGELNRIYSLSNLNSINNDSKSLKGSHSLLNCLNNSRSMSSVNSNSAITNNSTNNTISSYVPMQTDNKSPLSLSNKSKPISIPFGSNGSLHNREDDIQMDDVFSNNNQKSLGCNSLLAKMQLDVDNNTSKNKNDTQKFSKKKSYRPINRIRYLLQEESQNFLEKEIEHEAQTTLLLKQSSTDLSHDIEGKCLLRVKDLNHIIKEEYLCRVHQLVQELDHVTICLFHQI
ncbi:hypothetical protein PIROE2DRAFT_57754 [Piromyces sp. E2]|nr:hypothetical protein PIROE2DRAFT_57754 [Piromyces sp. E2]|eukprot:OUM68993.1 hypothetical protein PIROE2DRAFT_57754 [Piromyces sp. E2]